MHAIKFSGREQEAETSDGVADHHRQHGQLPGDRLPAGHQPQCLLVRQDHTEDVAADDRGDRADLHGAPGRGRRRRSVPGSLALLADAGHALTDAAGLPWLSWPGLATKPATPQRTWGYRHAEVLVAAACMAWFGWQCAGPWPRSSSVS